jgi:hypothetical protein
MYKTRLTINAKMKECALIFENRMNRQAITTREAFEFAAGIAILKRKYDIIDEYVDKWSEKIASVVEQESQKTAQEEFDKYFQENDPLGAQEKAKTTAAKYNAIFEWYHEFRVNSEGMKPSNQPISVVSQSSLPHTQETEQVSSHQSTAQSIGVSPSLGSNQMEILAYKPLAV